MEQRNEKSGRVGILANPMSGRDVRRLAARASNMTHEAKRDIVARVAAGASAAGAREILVMREPFRIATGALELMSLSARVRVLDVGISNSGRDTVAFVQALRAEGCDVLVALGGDGTSRLIARTWPDVPLIALSTGTNNVFPLLAEATGAGMAAGLVASGATAAVSRRAKLLQVALPAANDVALIDVALIANDHVGNALPVDADRLRRVLLTRAEPGAVGMSPIGGLLDPVGADDDWGLCVDCGIGEHVVEAPIAPGFFRRLRVATPTRIPLGACVDIDGPGVLALDGDREHMLAAGQRARVQLSRAGPLVVDVAGTLQQAATQGLFRRRFGSGE